MMEGAAIASSSTHVNHVWLDHKGTIISVFPASCSILLTVGYNMLNAEKAKTYLFSQDIFMQSITIDSGLVSVKHGFQTCLFLEI